jgi:hypothetical protein
MIARRAAQSNGGSVARCAGERNRPGASERLGPIWDRGNMPRLQASLALHPIGIFGGQLAF